MHSRGFTLIEILAVLVIIGIVTAIAVISLRTMDSRDEAGKTAQHLGGLIQLASENARAENIQYGLRIDPHHFGFMRFNGRGWDPVRNDPVLARQSVPSGLTLAIHTQGEIKIPVVATASGTVAAAAAMTASPQISSPAAMTAEAAGSGEPVPPPQVAILSSGELTPFTLTLTTATGKTYVVHGDGNGQIHVEAPGTNAAPLPATY